MIPIWGSGRDAVYNFQKGNYGWGTFYTVLAITDVFLVKSLVTAVGKGIFKAGATAVVKEGAEKTIIKEGGETLLKEGGEAVLKEGAEKVVVKEGGETALKETTKTAAKEGTETVAKEGAAATTKTAAQVVGKIAYGSTDLSKIAQAYRKAKQLKSGNIAVFEYLDEAGKLKTIALESIGASSKTKGTVGIVGHAERRISRSVSRKRN